MNDTVEVPRSSLQRLRFSAAWYSSDARGQSSDALVAHVLGGPEPTEGRYPIDWSDLGRCLGAYRMACSMGEPYDLPKAMHPTLCKYAEYVAERMRERS